MLGKLMKYEFKSTGRVFLPLFAALLILSAVNRVFIEYDVEVPRVIGIVVSVILITGIVVVTLLLTLQRFSKSLLQNEGYLMLTLPVKTDSLIISKLFVSAIWNIASFIVVLLAIFIMAAVDFSGIAEAFREFGRMLSLEKFQTVVTIIETVVAIILYVFSAILMLYASMSLSLLVNKRRGLFTFGAFIVISIVLQILSHILVRIADAMNLARLFDGLGSFGLSQVIILNWALIAAALCAAFYFITRYMLKNRLNLQ